MLKTKADKIMAFITDSALPDHESIRDAFYIAENSSVEWSYEEPREDRVGFLFDDNSTLTVDLVTNKASLGSYLFEEDLTKTVAERILVKFNANSNPLEEKFDYYTEYIGVASIDWSYIDENQDIITYLFEDNSTITAEQSNFSIELGSEVFDIESTPDDDESPAFSI